MHLRRESDDGERERDANDRHVCFAHPSSAARPASHGSAVETLSGARSNLREEQTTAAHPRESRLGLARVFLNQRATVSVEYTSRNGR